MLISHEWVAPTGGSENVFRELLTTFPDAAAVCLWNEVPDTFDRPVEESRLAQSRLRGRKALALPFMPGAWKEVPLDGVGAVVASSHAFGHHLAGRAAREGLPAFSYVHTPARYIWAPEVEMRGQGLRPRLASAPLKRIDRHATHSAVSYAANSQYIRDRIRRSWDRDGIVINPPVDVERIRSQTSWADQLTEDESRLLQQFPKEPFILGASRLVSYKRLDLVIALGQRLDMPVVLAGSGPDEEELRAAAAAVAVPVQFVGRVSDMQLFALYQKAALFAFLAIEDFGVMPVEAMAAGTPVLVNAVGGAAESVAATGGGLAAPEVSDVAQLAASAEAAMAIDMSSPAKRTDQFSRTAFRDRVRAWVTP